MANVFWKIIWGHVVINFMVIWLWSHIIQFESVLLPKIYDLRKKNPKISQISALILDKVRMTTMT